jgi:hypothetical protein
MQKEKKEKGFLRNVTARWAYSHLGVFFLSLPKLPNYSLSPIISISRYWSSDQARNYCILSLRIDSVVLWLQSVHCGWMPNVGHRLIVT